MRLWDRYSPFIAVLLILLENGILSWWFLRVLNPRLKPFPAWLFYALASAAVNTISALLPIPYGMAVLYLSSFLLTTLFFTDTIWVKVVQWGLFVLALFTSQTVFGLLVRVFGLTLTQAIANPFFHLVILTLSYGGCLLLLLPVEKWLRKRQDALPLKDLVSFSLVPVCEVALLAGLIGCLVMTQLYQMYLIMLLAVPLVAVSIALMFRGLRRLEESARTEARLSYIDAQQKFQLEHYTALERQIEEARKLRHDLVNYTETLEILLARKEYDVVEGCAGQLKNLLAENPLAVYCENPIVNAILYHKVRHASTFGIKCEIQLNLAPNCGIRPMELIGLFGNLMDNAIEAASQSREPREISLHNLQRAGFCVLTLRNSKAPGMTQFLDGKPVSGKATSELHGIGALILSDIVSQYDGSLSFVDEIEHFTTTVTLHLMGL